MGLGLIVDPVKACLHRQPCQHSVLVAIAVRCGDVHRPALVVQWLFRVVSVLIPALGDSQTDPRPQVHHWDCQRVQLVFASLQKGWTDIQTDICQVLWPFKQLTPLEKNPLRLQTNGNNAGIGKNQKTFSDRHTTFLSFFTFNLGGKSRKLPLQKEKEWQRSDCKLRLTEVSMETAQQEKKIEGPSDIWQTVGLSD